jgi:HlyD family secretion protein
MKRPAIILLIVAVAGAVAFLTYRNFLAPVPGTPTPTVEVAVVPSTVAVVSAEGFVVPARWADLSFKVPGQIVELLVKEGDGVQAGQVLARLDNTDPLSAVAQAEDAVRQAEAGVAQAEADVQQAESGVAQAKAAVEVASAAVVSAQAQLAQVKAGSTAEQIAQAEAAVGTARARLNQTKAAARPEDLDAQASALLKAEAAVRQAQTEYDKISWADNKGETPQALALQQATLDYQAAKAQYDRLKNGATEEEIAMARAGVAEAEAALAVVKAGPTQEAIVIAEAAVTQAEANVKQAEAGVPTAEAALAAAQAHLKSAEVALSTAGTNLETAKKDLADYNIVAPFAGTMSRVRVNQGEFVPAGTPVMSLGNNSTWHVDTDDLSEIDVVRVIVGQEAEVKIDALPGQEFKGVVTRVTPRSETKRGDVTYTVTIELEDAQNAPLRWGMTAFVDISVGK